ncbi:MAG: MFS transporter [Desulfobacterales bacterium]|jgi:YNFM family putative membrane transporter
MTRRITDHPPILLLQGLVFCLVAAGFTTIYMTQPVLPIIQAEFGVDETVASFTVSGVILGIALSNLPFGAVADAFPIRPIILVGGTVIGLSSLVCFGTRDLYSLIAARCVQGVFIPAITTCLAAYLSTTLPRENLNTVMGAYIAATVAGGLGGRLIGGWLHSPSEWRLGFLSSGALVGAATLAAVLLLPDEKPMRNTGKKPVAGVLALIRQKRIWGCLGVSFSAFYVFSSIFNYLPFYLSDPPFSASTRQITLMYLSYVFGIVAAPLAGRLSNRFGNGPTMTAGAAVFTLSIASTFIHSLPVIAASLAGVCTGFFTVHTAAIGALNRRLNHSKGLANSLYVLSYYMGGAVGVTLSGWAYQVFRWPGVAVGGCIILTVPIAVGIAQAKEGKDSPISGELPPRGGVP